MRCDTPAVRAFRLLLAALAATPRRYRMPSLPADAAAARAEGPEVALAFAIEAARHAKESGGAPAAQAQDLFTWGLAEFIREALAPRGGDPGFQALVLQAQDAAVQEYARLATAQAADRRAVRTAVDAVAHPGKLRGAGEPALARLHALAAAADWPALRQSALALLSQGSLPDAAARATLEALLAGSALQRLLRRAELLALAPVQRYRDLCAARGPLAGSDAAAAQGRASARIGQDAEQATAQAFQRIAALLDAGEDAGAVHRALHGLRTPRGFPGDAGKAKDEWDAALVRQAPGASGAQILLLAEVKASPAAATSDFSRLRRGLQRLAQASADRSYAFLSDDGEVPVDGTSLRALQPDGHVLPAHVVYCCSAPPEPQVQVLAAASKSVLAAEPASVAFAQRLARGETPPHGALAPVWQALATAPRLRATLHQFETACAARDAMIHPQDLLSAVEAVVGAP